MQATKNWCDEKSVKKLGIWRWSKQGLCMNHKIKCVWDHWMKLFTGSECGDRCGRECMEESETVLTAKQLSSRVGQGRHRLRSDLGSGGSAVHVNTCTTQRRRDGDITSGSEAGRDCKRIPRPRGFGVGVSRLRPLRLVSPLLGVACPRLMSL